MARVMAEQGHPEGAVRLVGMPFIATGQTEEELRASIADVKNNIAF